MWEWNTSIHKAFETLKTCLCSSPVLALPQPDRPFTLITNCSYNSISAILEQLQTDGKNHLVSYANRCCHDADTKLRSSKEELLATVFELTKFQHFITGSKFTLATNSSAVVYLKSGKVKNPKFAHWAVVLANHHFQVEYKPGIFHTNVDRFSWALNHPVLLMPAP